MTEDTTIACCAPGRPGATGSDIRPAPPPMRERSRTPPARKGLIDLPGGTFLMGTDAPGGFPADGEGPVREVTIRPFSIARAAVTTAEFAAFVRATGYQTEAERFGWSFVFHLFVPPGKKIEVLGSSGPAPWWLAVAGACWNAPEGPGSTLRGRRDHPVVHVSWSDAMAYCDWAGLRLPTEAEWEYAARGGLTQARYPWGDELTPGGKHRMNIWQGTFPASNTVEDGHAGTAPVNAFRPNGHGLFNMTGNVWEWCADWFSPTHHVTGPRLDPTGPPTGQARVMRGGSYLCHHSYCTRYRVAARGSNTPESSTGNHGFRCAADARQPGNGRT